jgi:O-antigen/teichoic acid export membrane protein
MPGLFRNTFYSSLAQGWQMIMALVLFKAATSGLGRDGFGLYTLATTYMYFVLLFDDFGVNTYITREIARDRKTSRALFALGAGLKIALIPAGVLFILLVLAFKPVDAEARAVIWIFAGYGVVMASVQMVYAVFRGHERMEYEAVVTVAEKTLSTAAGVCAVVFGLGLVRFSWMFASTGLVALGLSLGLLSRRIHPPACRFQPAESGRLLRSSSAFGLALFVTYIYGNLAVPMLSWMGGDLEAVGLFGSAQKILNFTSFIPLVFATAFFPRFSAVVSDREELSRVFTIGCRYLLMIAVPLVPGVLFTADRLIVTFADASFAEAAGALRILVFSAALNFINLFTASLYGACNRQRLILAFEIAALAVNVAFNLVLIPRFSFMGAAWATLVTESFVFILSLAWALRYLVRITEWAFLLPVTAAAGLMTLFLAATPRLAVVPAVAGAIVLYTGVLFAMKALSIEQIRSQLTGLK